MASADSKRALKLSSGKSQTNNAQSLKSPVKKSSVEPVSTKNQSMKSTKVSSTASNGAKSSMSQKAPGERQESVKNLQNVKHPPQPYKQRHNIGRRVAAERIGTYNEVELAECYSGVGSARWLSGNADLGFKPDLTKQGSDDIDNEGKTVGKSESKKKSRADSQNPDQSLEIEKKTEVASKSKCSPAEKAKKSSSSEEVVPELTSSSKQSPAKGKITTNVTKKGSGTACNTATSSSSVEAMHQDQNTVAADSLAKPVLKDVSELKEDPSSEGLELKPHDVKDGGSPGLPPKKQLKLASHTSSAQISKAPPVRSAEKSAAKKSVSKSAVKAKCSQSKGVVYDSEPEAPRSKRMARLNAEAIMSLMCERDEAVPTKRARLDYSEISSESESNVSSDSSDEDESAEAFRRQFGGKKSVRNRPADATTKESISQERDGLASSKSGSGDPKSKGRSKADSKCKVLGKSKTDHSNQMQENELKAARKDKKVREEVNLNVSSPSPPPKRMASLNAQAILAASKDDKVKKAKFPGDLQNLSVLKTDEKSAALCPNTGTGDNSKASENHSVAVKGTFAQSSLDNSKTSNAAEKQHADVSSHATSCPNTSTAAFTEASSGVSDSLAASAPVPLTSSLSAVAAPVSASQASVSHSSNNVISQGRSLSKARIKQSQSHSRTGSEHGTSRSQQSSDWSKQASDGRTATSSSDAPGSNFCQPTIGAPPSQALGFPVATRLTATVAPSPVRFNVPVIMPQPSVAGYLAAAARPPHHAYYPYAAGQNVFAYPVAGYPSTAHSYGSSTVASWSGLQDISQFSYQPALAAASLCSTGAGRGSGVLPQQQLPLQSPQQASQFFRPCFQPLAQAHQTHQYPNLQPAHSSLALYPARLGVVASTDGVLPSSKVPETSAAKGFDSRALAGIPGAGVLPVQPSTVPPNQFASAVTSSPSSKSKRPSSSASSNAGFRNDSSSTTPASTHCHRDTGNAQSTREISSCGSESSSPLVKSYYVLGNDRRSATVVTESAVVTAPTIIQPFGIYAGCVSAPFNVAGLSPGQTSQAMPLGCFQPAGPLIPVPAFWDMQGFGQVPQLVPAVKQTSADQAVAEKGMPAALLPDKSRGDSCTQTVGRSAASSSSSKGSGKKSRSRLQADSVVAGGAAVTPKKLETAVVTAIQMSAVNQYVDQERELDLSQKSSTVSSTSSAVGTNNAASDANTQNKLESRQQQIGDQNSGVRSSTEGAVKTASSSAISQIRNLERFVSGMVADNVQPTSAESFSDKRPIQSHLAKKPSKRKLDMSPDCSVPDPTRGQSVKRAKHMNVGSTETVRGFTQSPLSKPVSGSPVNVEQQCRGLDILLPNESRLSETKCTDILLINSPAVSRPSPGESSDVLCQSTVIPSSPDVKLKNDIQTVDAHESLTVLNVSLECKIDSEVQISRAYSCSDSSSSSPKLVIDETDKTSPVKPNDGFFVNTPEVCSPVKQDVATVSKTKSGAGSDSGKKRRKEVMGSAVRDKKSVAGEVSADDKLQKLRSWEDSVKKTSKTGLWEWYGDGEMKLVHSKVDTAPVARMCYPAVRHADGDIICVRDCVLVKSGMRKKDIPYVAKIDKFWEDPESGEMFMSILWYYRLEHTGTDPLPRYIDCEVFASRHRDVIPVACIEDRCYVLTLGEFNRYKAELRRRQSGCLPRAQVVPQLVSATPGSFSKETSVRKLHRSGVSSRLPDYTVDQETIFLCRQVYDIKLRRILKNPPIHVSGS